MDSRYKIILSNRNKNIYKEIELPAEAVRLAIGTGMNCDVRLHKSLFFEPVELVFAKDGGRWLMSCSDNLYLSVGDVRKIISQPMEHGDTVTVKYQASDTEVFTIDFLIDFSSGTIRYERSIDLAAVRGFTIGSAANANIAIGSPYVEGDIIRADRQGDSLRLEVVRSRYGVYLNGNRISRSAEVKNGDFFEVSDFFFYLKDGMLLTQIRGDMRVNGLAYTDRPLPDTYPMFNRSTRLKHAISEDPIEILDPPTKPQEPKNNLLIRLLPSLGMIIACGVMAFFGRSMILFSIISGGMGVITSVLTLREGKKEYKQGLEDRVEKYTAYIDRKREEIEAERQAEKTAMEELYISQTAEEERFGQFSPLLFERTPQDDDFLCVRLGEGAVEARRKIDHKHKEQLEVDDELQLLPEQLSEQFRYIQSAPVVCDLKSVNAIGVTGSELFRFEMLKNIVIDIVARQYYSDVRMVFAADGKNAGRIGWLRMLPHVCDEASGARMLVVDNDSKNLVFEYLYKELSAREQAKEHAGNIVVFFYDECGFKTHPISRFVGQAQQLGVTFVFFGDTPTDIPMGCGYIITQDSSSGGGKLIKTDDKDAAVDFSYPHISDRDAEKIIDLMAPVYSEAISLEGTLTKSISLFEMMNILAVDDIDLQERWSMSQVYSTMAAPIGVSMNGTVCLDLHDKADGPHGLVAGTTGSGKSELLQTYILSMSTLFHPYEVGFVIIDFKGGGMVNQFKDLPHLLGAITNIDGKEIERSLKSIRAELQKRQRLFAAADVNHIDRYIKKYRAGEVDTPLPHLILIVDEFAELKAQQPEFMKELISAARIGRSLGVHLILATQKPAGQVDDQIWSNSRFKLCLKVATSQDSNEMIKSPLAAEIREPGRAYLMLGENESLELFQSAYSGGPARTYDVGGKEFTIYSVSPAGRRAPVFAQKREKGREESSTQLQSVVEYIRQYCQRIGLHKLPDICLPSLAERIDFPAPAKMAAAAPGRVSVELGVADDPENQEQNVFSLDLASNNLMIIGSSQMGKTNLLQNIIRGLSAKYAPEEATIYIIDFASMVLKNFESLRHVGGVVCPTDDEKLKNLFKLLSGEIKERKEKLVAMGVSSFAAYKEAGKTDMPLIVLMVDNLTALKEMYLQDDDVLLNFCREGLSVGISIVIANSQTAGIGYKYLSNFSSRIALYCNDSGEYSSLLDHCRERIDSIPGRCIVDVEKRHLECQTYLAFAGEREIDRVNEITAYIEQINQTYSASSVKEIPSIPATLTADYVAAKLAGFMQRKFSLVAGLDYETITPQVLDFASMGLLAVTGRTGAGRHNWVNYALGMLERMYPGQSEVYFVDSIEKRLEPMRRLKNARAYSRRESDAAAYVVEIEKRLKERYDAVAAGDESALETSKLLVLVIDNQDAYTAINDDLNASTAYRNILGRYKNMRACIIAFVDNANIPYSAPEMLKTVRDQHQVMYFDDVADMKIMDLPLDVMRRFKKPIVLGDGYYFVKNESHKLKTALQSESG